MGRISTPTRDKLLPVYREDLTVSEMHELCGVDKSQIYRILNSLNLGYRLVKGSEESILKVYNEDLTPREMLNLIPRKISVQSVKNVLWKHGLKYRKNTIKEDILELNDMGFSVSEIAKKTGYKYNTVYITVKRELSKQEEDICK